MGLKRFSYIFGVAAATIISVVLLLSFYFINVFAAGETISGGADVDALLGEATAISDITIVGNGGDTVPVQLHVENGSLSFGSTTGLTFDGASSGADLSFSGTVDNVNAALDTLTYTGSVAGADTLEVSLIAAGEVFFSGTGNLYEFVSATLSWTQAKTAAEGRTKYGATGYLTTITSQAENDFVADRLLNAGWMGASDSANENDWKWVTGPENGTSFWSGLSNGSPVSGRYSNWSTGEPNNSGDEDCAQFLAGSSGKWNDLPCTDHTLPGYVVEYGTSENPPTVESLEVDIDVLIRPDEPSSLGAAGLVNGSWQTDDTPTLSFSLADDDSSVEPVRYVVQIDDSSDFSSLVVDYTSAGVSEGSNSFSVGQAEGSGTYSSGGAGVSLDDGQYYWRVKAIDIDDLESSFTTANGGSIAFGVDTTSPTKPGSISLATPTNDSTPEISWGASTDAGSGLHSTGYSVEWSGDSNFASFGGSVAVSGTTGSLTELEDGDWYVRVRARDNVGYFSEYSDSAMFTLDTELPSVETFTPLDGAGKVRKNSNLTIAFSENISKGTGNITIYKASNDEVFEQIDVASEKVTASANQLIIDPGTDFKYLGEYYIQIDNTAVKDIATNLYAGISDSTTWNYAVEGTDFDNDGIASEEEDDAPNGGDGNNDGILDSEQANVSSFVSDYTNQYSVLVTDSECTIVAASIEAESNVVDDSEFDYPAGMMDFRLSCPEGFSADVTHYYYGETMKNYIARKYNSNTGEYTSIDDAEITRLTIDGESVIRLDYEVQDGGQRDEDGQVNGIIVDPAGIGIDIDDELAKTGQGALIVSAFGFALIPATLLIAKLSVSTKPTE